jgi:hypothetical protein
VTGELARSAPAFEAMAELAGETGGRLLNQEPPAAWLPEVTKNEAKLEPVVSERRHSLWNSWTMLMLAFGIYSLELILRRLWKLL